MAEKLAPDKRHSFVHNGQKVFEWDQTLEEVNVYLDLPSNVPKKLFYCKIQSKHIEVGIRGNPPYLNVRPRPHPSLSSPSHLCSLSWFWIHYLSVSFLWFLELILSMISPAP
ncbi:hypothetical protein COCNU_10G004010 [Cocos nucifera]|uniref:CS domain-containing protein n=1 Tax=Cocos nucifera TaxID=13894 RepID=A0A8K0IMA6_COCNU|nr:hypothetical protein COCNU_10G004010 [Cocos nucifera]